MNKEKTFEFENGRDYFVFGSNTGGIHGAGSANWANRFYKARYGVGEGITGMSYALPSKVVRNGMIDNMSWEEFKEHCDKFIRFAMDNPEKRFWLTKVGCGLAGFREEDVRSIFLSHDVPANILIPGTWLKYKNPKLARIIVAGSRECTDENLVYTYIATHISGSTDPDYDIEIVSGMARGPDMFGYQYAKDHSIPVAKFPAQWDLFGQKTSGMVRNNLMAMYSTDLVAFHLNDSPGTRNMIITVRREGLNAFVYEKV